MNFCMHCGAPLKGVDATFCPNCGKRLKNAETPAVPEETSVPKEPVIPETPKEPEMPAEPDTPETSVSDFADTSKEGDTPVTLDDLFKDPVEELEETETATEPAAKHVSSAAGALGAAKGMKQNENRPAKPETPEASETPAAPVKTVSIEYAAEPEDENAGPAESAQEADEPVSVPAAAQTKKKGLIIGIAAAIVVVLLVIAGFVAMGGDKDIASSGQSIFEPASQYEELAAEISEAYNVNAELVSTDVSEYPKVKLYFHITDEYGDSVSLATAKAALRERLSGGEFVEREVKSIQRIDGKEGLSIDLVVDKSGSMDGSLYRVQEVMTEFVESLDYKAGDKVEIISFDSYVMYMCSYTNDVNLMRNGINNMTPYGMTALYDALAEGITNAKNQGGARCVIAFTDGYDNESSYTPDQIIAMAQNYSVPVFIIGAGDVDSYTLQRIATSTGGYYWDIYDLYDMNDILRQIYSEQKDMYCIEYITDSAAGQYDERAIEYIIYDGDYGCSSGDVFTPVKTIEKVKHSSRYELVKDTVSWSEANQAALAKGGHLATITSESEMQQLSQMSEQAGLKYVWLGGYTSVRYDEAFGHWVTGENFDYTAWYPGEPSRNDKDGAPEMYLMLWKVNEEWSWNDQRNDPAGETGLKSFIDTTGYIIEYED